MTEETRLTRLKRVRMRAWHRGMKEMDIILGRFADEVLDGFSDDALDHLELLMEENDQDLYQWVTGQTRVPARFAELIGQIAAHAGA